MWCAEYNFSVYVFSQVAGMAFFGRVGNILRQATNQKIGLEIRSLSSVFQATRCMSNAPNSRLFIGGVFELTFALFLIHEVGYLCLFFG